MTELLHGESGLWVLFSTGFLSATLLPGGSEVNVVTALKVGTHPAWLILTVVTVGNTFGGLTNYALGRLLPHRQFTGRHTARAQRWLEKYGIWTLLLSWLPLIGDPLCLVAGWLRMRLIWCSTAILVGKALRYLVLILLMSL